MSLSHPDPLAVVATADDDEDDPAGGPVMQTITNPEAKVGAMESTSLDVRMDSLPPGQKIPRGQRNTPATNTGPKGVIKDYNQAKQNLDNIRRMQRLRNEVELNKKAAGATQFVLTADGKSPAGAAEAAAKPKAKKKADESESDEEFGEDEDDELIFEQYKQQRVASVLASLPKYGKHERVTLEQLGEIVRKENEFVYVVVHLYQNHIESCIRVNLAMEELAKQFPYVHFVRIRSTEAMPAYPDTGLPTIIVYRNAKAVHEFVRLADQLKSISDVTLAHFLAKKGILRQPTALEEASVSRAQEKLKSKDQPTLIISFAGLNVKDTKPKTSSAATAAAAAAAGATASTAAADPLAAKLIPTAGAVDSKAALTSAPAATVAAPARTVVASSPAASPPPAIGAAPAVATTSPPAGADKK